MDDDNIDYKHLTKMVETNTKKNHMAYEINGKLTPNVANLGGKIGDIAKLERSGEYYGIAVELLDFFRPLLTDRFVVRLLTMLKKEDYITPLTILDLKNLDQLYYILHKWFQSAVVGYRDELGKEEYPEKYSEFDDWISSVTHDPLLGRIKIVGLGHNQNTDSPVVPAEWLDREFKNGYELHKEMDKLETRIGKPPVTYAVIYSMIIQKNDSMLDSVDNVKFSIIFYLDVVGEKLKSTRTDKLRGDKKSSHLTHLTHLTQSGHSTHSYVQYRDILIGFKLNEILEPKTIPSKIEVGLVGLLVSRLQKAIRRGRYGSVALMETIDSLNISPNYNLPEHNFMRVSAAKQLVWRLFITILEDCRPYQSEPISPTSPISMLTLMLLVLITQKVQEYQFTQTVLNAIKFLAIAAQFNDTPDDAFDFRSLTIYKKLPNIPNILSDFHTAIALALNNSIMMEGDNVMLRKYYSADDNFLPFKIPKRKTLYHDPSVYDDIMYSSYDMHVKPHIILYYQACIPISMTTREISGYIWDVSSSYNVRFGMKKPNEDKILRSIQQFMLTNPDMKKKTEQKSNVYKKLVPDNYAKRISFLILFGKKYRVSGKDVIIAGTNEFPTRVKVNNEWTYLFDEKILNAYPAQTISLRDIDPPFGYQWTTPKIKTEIINGIPIANKIKLNYFDGSPFIKSITPKIVESLDRTLYKYIVKLFSGEEIEFQILLNFRKKCAKKIANWTLNSHDIKKININLVKLAYTKLFNQFNNIITIGPVSRMGDKTQNSINYLLEGKLWAIFNLFSYLYPKTFFVQSALNFRIVKDSPGYVHVVDTLSGILFQHKNIRGTIPTIRTKLWDHQIESATRILSGFGDNRHGFGDASDVGAGKTLTSLKIAVELIRTNNNIYSGILVLLPGNKLIETWKTELEKHTSGFDVQFQKNEDYFSISRNTILVTTMGRMRDHPVNHRWLLVIIDECLSVQNRNALWTEEAWKQSMVSKYLVMMSATFFRTRFDKLYYMLKMLKTGLPERREYLDAILSESIVSQISLVKRKWSSNFNYFVLDKKSREEYIEIEKFHETLETKFTKLTSFLVNNDHVNILVTKQLGKLVGRLEKLGHGCAIYARAIGEARLWSDMLGIPIYPKKGEHCIVTYNDGTYGINDLVIYDTIIMRPPQSDKLPQIKGRLDRPGQKVNDLFIEYFILKDTIEEGLIIRLNIASQFLHKYIMPLAKFYDVSVNYKKYLEEDN